MKASGIAKAAVVGAFLAMPALAFPALAHAAPTETVCVAGPTVVCYVVPTAAMTQVTSGAPVSQATPSYNSWDDEGIGDTGGGGGAGG